MKSTPSGCVRLHSATVLDGEGRKDYQTLTEAVGADFRIFRDEDGVPFVLCAKGVRLFARGENRIDVFFPSCRPAARLKTVTALCPSAHVEQRGDGELICSVAVAEAGALLDYLQPRREVSAELREARRRRAVENPAGFRAVR